MKHEMIGERRVSRFVKDIGRLIEEDTARLEKEGKLNVPAEKEEAVRTIEPHPETPTPQPIQNYPVPQQKPTLIDTFGKDITLKAYSSTLNGYRMVVRSVDILASVADIYQFAKCATKQEMKQFRKGYQTYRRNGMLTAEICTSTLITRARDSKIEIVHHADSRIATTLETTVDLDYQWNLKQGSLNKWARERETYPFLKALFNTEDSPEEIRSHLKRLHSKLGFNIKLSIDPYEFLQENNYYIAIIPVALGFSVTYKSIPTTEKNVSVLFGDYMCTYKVGLK